jgi:lysophospholipase L1-like esterase
VLGASDLRGSLWAALAQRLSLRIQRPVVVIAVARGSTTFADWLDPQSGHLRALAVQAQAAAELGLPPNLILWHQGENDAASVDRLAAARAELTRLIDALFENAHSAPDARLMLYRVSICRQNPEGNPAFAKMQSEIASADSRILLGPDTDRWGKRFRHDGCHFNARGRDAVVEETLHSLGPWLDQRAAPLLIDDQ